MEKRRDKVMKTYGRHKNRIIKTDFWDSEFNDSVQNIFSLSRSFNDDSDFKESFKSITKRKQAKDSDKENKKTTKQTKATKGKKKKIDHKLFSEKESTSGFSDFSEGRPLKDLPPKTVPASVRKNRVANNTKLQFDQSQLLLKSRDKTASINFSEFDSYDLCISDSPIQAGSKADKSPSIRSPSQLGRELSPSVFSSVAKRPRSAGSNAGLKSPFQKNSASTLKPRSTGITTSTPLATLTSVSRLNSKKERVSDDLSLFEETCRGHDEHDKSLLDHKDSLSSSVTYDMLTAVSRRDSKKERVSDDPLLFEEACRGHDEHDKSLLDHKDSLSSSVTYDMLMAVSRRDSKKERVSDDPLLFEEACRGHDEHDKSLRDHKDSLGGSVTHDMLSDSKKERLSDDPLLFEEACRGHDEHDKSLRDHKDSLGGSVSYDMPLNTDSLCSSSLLEERSCLYTKDRVPDVSRVTNRKSPTDGTRPRSKNTSVSPGISASDRSSCLAQNTALSKDRSSGGAQLSAELEKYPSLVQDQINSSDPLGAAGALGSGERKQLNSKRQKDRSLGSSFSTPSCLFNKDDGHSQQSPDCLRRLQNLETFFSNLQESPSVLSPNSEPFDASRNLFDSPGPTSPDMNLLPDTNNNESARKANRLALTPSPPDLHLSVVEISDDDVLAEEVDFGHVRREPSHNEPEVDKLNKLMGSAFLSDVEEEETEADDLSGFSSGSSEEDGSEALKDPKVVSMVSDDSDISLRSGSDQEDGSGEEDGSEASKEPKVVSMVSDDSDISLRSGSNQGDGSDEEDGSEVVSSVSDNSDIDLHVDSCGPIDCSKDAEETAEEENKPPLAYRLPRRSPYLTRFYTSSICTEQDSVCANVTQCSGALSGSSFRSPYMLRHSQLLVDESKVESLPCTPVSYKDGSLGEEEEEVGCNRNLSHLSRISDISSSSRKSLIVLLSPKISPLSPRTKVLQQCQQTDFVSFYDCISHSMMKNCVKIGEGVYGEVFRTRKRGQSVALKIIPIEGDFEVNECPQKDFVEMLPEIIISKELSNLRNGIEDNTQNFVFVNSVSCLKGSYPAQLMKEWDIFHKQKRSENDRPDIFDNDQLFILFEFGDGGCALENFKFNNLRQAKSILQQVTYGLAVAESALEFEHRDLHWGNVLVRPCAEEKLHYRLKGSDLYLPSYGLEVSIIDFTLSRLQKDGCTVFCDLAKDPVLFEGTGDYQFDVYRLMKEQTQDQWERYCPKNNVYWIHYLADKLLRCKKYEKSTREDNEILRSLRQFVRLATDYTSAVDLVSTCTFINPSV